MLITAVAECSANGSGLALESRGTAQAFRRRAAIKEIKKMVSIEMMERKEKFILGSFHRPPNINKEGSIPGRLDMKDMGDFKYRNNDNDNVVVDQEFHEFLCYS